MLETKELQQSSIREERELASPVLIVKAHGNKTIKYGFRTPIGLGVIWRSTLVDQQAHHSRASFSNLKFEIAILDLVDDDYKIDTRWIHLRRQRNVPSADANQYAPHAWKVFLAEGLSSLPKLQLGRAYNPK